MKLIASRNKAPRSFLFYVLRYIALVFAVVYIISIYSFYQSISTIYSKQYDNSETMLENIFVETLEAAIWDFRYTEIKNVSEQILQSPFVEGVRIVFNDNKIVFEEGNFREGYLSDIPLKVSENPNAKQWVLQLGRSSPNIWPVLSKTLFAFSMIALMAFISIGYAFFRANRKLIYEPTRELQTALIQMNKTGEMKQIPVQGSREVTDVLQGYNVMARRLTHRNHIQKTLNAQAKTHFRGIQSVSTKLLTEDADINALCSTLTMALSYEPECVAAFVLFDLKGVSTYKAYFQDAELIGQKEPVKQILTQIMHQDAPYEFEYDLPNADHYKKIFQRVSIDNNVIGTILVITKSQDPIFIDACRVYLYSLANIASLALESKRRLQAEDALEITQKRAISTFSAMSIGLFILETNQTIQPINNSAYEYMSQLSVDLNKVADLTELLDTLRTSYPEFEKTFKAWLNKPSTSISLELEANGETWFEFTVTTLPDDARAIFVRDISFQKKLMLRNQQGERMKSLGRIAGGITHDFNNYLMAIRGNIELAQNKQTSQNDKYIKRALINCELAAKTTDQLLYFSQNRQPQVAPIAPKSAVDTAVLALRAKTNSPIEISINVQTSLNVCADPTMLNRALINLLSNSVDAVIDKLPKLKITIVNSLYDDMLDIIVTDNGSGFSTNVIAKASEPFFTTKPQGHGTGLGLFMVLDFVKNHGGHLKLDNAGNGARVIISLPATKNKPKVKEQRKSLPVRNLLKGKHILLIEDSPELTTLITSYLAQQKCKVTLLKSAEEAQSFNISDITPIDLVLSDINLPDGNGPDVVVQLFKAHDNQPIPPCIFMSGDASIEIPSHLGLQKTIFLAKPFRLSELNEILPSLITGNKTKSAKQDEAHK